VGHLRLLMAILAWALLPSLAYAQSVVTNPLIRRVTGCQSTVKSVLGTCSGEEPAYRNSEGELTGPTKYVFHILPSCRAFVEWMSRRSGKSGRIFGVYSTSTGRRGVKVQAQFVPSMDSLATDSPATDYFDAFTFQFSDDRVTVRYIDDPKAPKFLVSRVYRKHQTRRRGQASEVRGR